MGTIPLRELRFYVSGRRFRDILSAAQDAGLRPGERAQVWFGRSAVLVKLA